MIDMGGLNGELKGFREAHEYYKKQLQASGLCLVVSAIIIFILAFVIVGGYLFDFTELPWLGPLSQKLRGEQGVSFAGLAGRLILILPLAWIFAIQVKNHRIIFDLHQAYLHRKIVADSLPVLQELILRDEEKKSARSLLCILLCTLYHNPLPKPTECEFKCECGCEESKEEGQVEKQKEKQKRVDLQAQEY
jgi:hypothetical protein